jgi:lipid-A-disaccharide synthase-like uncharacterized protein
MEIFVKIMGAIGLLFITGGIFIKNEIKQDWIFIAGGFGLLIYSLWLKDPIFIPLQIIYIIASLYEIIILTKKKK